MKVEVLLGAKVLRMPMAQSARDTGAVARDAFVSVEREEPAQPIHRACSDARCGVQTLSLLDLCPYARQCRGNIPL